MIEELIKDNIINYGTLGIWTLYLLFKENQTHKQFMQKLEQLIEEIRKIKK